MAARRERVLDSVLRGWGNVGERLRRRPRQPRTIQPATDIQAVLTVLGRRCRDEGARKQDQLAGRRLDLKKTDLRGAELMRAQLETVNLLGAHLEAAKLMGARLKNASFVAAHLQGALLREAHLEGAHLLDAVGLTQEQLAEAFGDAKTKVANELRPAHWPAAAPDEPDNAR